VFDHVEIHVADLASSRTFYVEALGLPTHDGELVEWGDFGIVEVDAWWNRMTEAGYENDGKPGERPQYSASYYGAFARDPDGNSVEAVHHATSRAGEIDHLWLRTRDVSSAKRFYETVAPIVGIELEHAESDFLRMRFADGRGSFSFVDDDTPTQHVHLAFEAPDFDTVKRFHEAALDAGYQDNGPPGERPQYHPGYYGAFVLDADGHNVEAVFHDRSR
jgi:catechol 2,3-dioxygenase-like lactoylglutathione lyase family enzyme